LKIVCCRNLFQYKQMFECCIVVSSVITGKLVLLDLCVRHGISPKVYLADLTGSRELLKEKRFNENCVEHTSDSFFSKGERNTSICHNELCGTYGVNLCHYVDIHRENN
jgi:hypothetical protein